MFYFGGVDWHHFVLHDLHRHYPYCLFLNSHPSLLSFLLPLSPKSSFLSISPTKFYSPSTMFETPKPTNTTSVAASFSAQVSICFETPTLQGEAKGNSNVLVG